MHKGIVAPCAFKRTVAEFNPQFEKFDQEDSQELLVDLMDKVLCTYTMHHMHYTNCPT
jgi:ubiquitin C-terminal hydrolase